VSGMTRQKRLGRALTAVLAAVLLVWGSPLGAGAAVIESLLDDPLEAARGLGWAVHPDQDGNGTERFVEGPLTPPSGRGSLEMSAPTGADRALIFTVPKPSTGVPIGEIAESIAIPWEATTGSFSTFTTNAAEPAASIPGLLLVGFQHFDPTTTPPTLEEFTVVHLEGGFQTALSPAPAPNVWRTWTLNDQAVVWQSNTQDGFCGVDAPCTFGEFASTYDTGAWGQIQLGMGTGLPANSTGYVDNVVVSNPAPSNGLPTFVADFEAPAAQASTATIAGGAATATGGSVTVTLNSSQLAALGSTPFTITFSGTSAVSPTPVTVPAGQSSMQSFNLPFGTTQVTVQAQGVTLASSPITFQAPTTTSTPTAPTTTAPSPTTPTPPAAPIASTPPANTPATDTTSGTGVRLAITG
jgi:hypothetical protein